MTDISFGVRKGEFFGIVGRNGSGKSTLLKCLAGIYAADTGRIWVDGRLSTFIELGVGFNPDLAALDNVVLNGIMLGLSPKEARDRYERVIEFAELKEFEDLKLKNYSSGMHVRLAFSVAIQVDADILLIDEVLAVGDAAFQQKCFDVFNQMRDAGRTIVFVTHDMSAVNRFCHRALLLERGRAVMLGEPDKVADRYLSVNFDHTAALEAEAAAHHGLEAATEETTVRGFGDEKASIVEVWLEDDHGNRVTLGGARADGLGEGSGGVQRGRRGPGRGARCRERRARADHRRLDRRAHRAHGALHARRPRDLPVQLRAT